MIRADVRIEPTQISAHGARRCPVCGFALHMAIMTAVRALDTRPEEDGQPAEAIGIYCCTACAERDVTRQCNQTLYLGEGL